MDAITVLKDDHRAVDKLFKRFEKAGAGAHKTKRRLVDSMIKELVVHSAIEEEVLYPTVRAEIASESGLVLEALEEHHVVEWLLAELGAMSPEDERFDAKVTVLIESVRHHVVEEEDVLFPKVRSSLGRRRLRELGEDLEAARRTAPTRPHPRSPDEPPANLIANTMAGLVDRARGVVRKTAESS